MKQSSVLDFRIPTNQTCNTPRINVLTLSKCICFFFFFYLLERKEAWLNSKTTFNLHTSIRHIVTKLECPISNTLRDLGVHTNTDQEYITYVQAVMLKYPTHPISIASVIAIVIDGSLSYYFWQIEDIYIYDNLK